MSHGGATMPAPGPYVYNPAAVAEARHVDWSPAQGYTTAGLNTWTTMATEPLRRFTMPYNGIVIVHMHHEATLDNGGQIGVGLDDGAGNFHGESGAVHSGVSYYYSIDWHIYLPKAQGVEVVLRARYYYRSPATAIIISAGPGSDIMTIPSNALTVATS